MLAVRVAAAQLLGQILQHQGSLSSLLPSTLLKVAEQDRPLLQQLCFGVCRHYPQLHAYLAQLMERPLRPKDVDVQALLLLGLYQLVHTRIPDHAAISETVEGVPQIKKSWATKLVNGVLRQFQRERSSLESKLQDNDEFQTHHPAWLEGMLRKNWPNQVNAILQVNNQHPPFTLRLNTRARPRADYLQQLADLGFAARATEFSPYGVTLEQPCDPRALPGFTEGLVSVQDEAAQLSADLLALSPGMKVLDACAAPGGKTGHLLEVEPSTDLVALDIEERRLLRVRENLARLNVCADVRCGNAASPDTWWDGEPFDRVLLDAPCSATGIIRRHPDIKILRTPEDIARLSTLQGQLLDSLWPLLKPGGILVYATCSIMPRENTRVIEAFLQREAHAHCLPLVKDWGVPQPCGRQLLPQIDGHDGFYYAVLQKSD